MGSLKSSKTTPKSSHFNAGRTRTRPCVYCGAFFFDFERLRKHEESEAERFREEREKIQSEKPNQAIYGRTRAPLHHHNTHHLKQYQHHHLQQYQHHHQQQHQHRHPQQHQYHHHHLPQYQQKPVPINVTFYRIDRTVEEFGEDWEEDQIYPPFYPTKVLSCRQLNSQTLNTTTINNINNNNVHDKLLQRPDSFASLNPVLLSRPEQEPDYQSLGENSWITFEPTRMPSMPESKIVVQSRLDQYLNKLNEEEWVKFIKEQLTPSPPPVVEDPNRMDCRHCGLIFNEVHVRRFHEESHGQEREEREERDEELACGYCGKMFTNLTHKKIHERAHQSLEDPTAVPVPALPVFGCRQCGRRFMLERELASHIQQNQCGGVRSPAKSDLPRQTSNSRPRLAEQDGWTEDPRTLPKGWKVRTRPRATQAGQLFFLFLSPDGKVFHSRKKVMEHMESLGGYSQFDFDKVKEGSKNPRKSVGVGRKQEDEETSTKDSPKKKKTEEDNWSPQKRKASKVTKAEDEEKENKTEAKPKRSKRSI